MFKISLIIDVLYFDADVILLEGAMWGMVTDKQKEKMDRKKVRQMQSGFLCPVN